MRVLEYYAGVLFLTTNRLGDFDEAFSSRIHVSLHYPPLSLKSTKNIFQLNLKLIQRRFEDKGRKIDIEEDAILKYATDYWKNNKKMRWNGRQIRNACQTALALAEFDAQGGSHETVKNADAEVKLTIRHLETVSNAYLEFSKYLKRVYGKDLERRAKEIGIRAREIEDDMTEEEDSEEEDNTAANSSARSTAQGPLATPQQFDTSNTSQPSWIPMMAPNMQGGATPYGYPLVYAQPPPHPSQQAGYPQTRDQQNFMPPSQAWSGPNAAGWQGMSIGQLPYGNIPPPGPQHGGGDGTAALAVPPNGS